MNAPQLGHLFSLGSLYVLIPLAIALVTFSQKLIRHKLALPPGPPGDFLFGHIFKIPHLSAGIVYANWAKQYGDLICLKIFGRPMMICNSFEVASELMENRGSIYSDRPQIQLADMIGWGNTMVLLGYNDRWRKQRRLMQKAFNKQESLSFRPSTQIEVEKFLKSINHYSGNVRPRIHRLVTAALSVVAYGHEVNSDDDEIATQMERIGTITSELGNSGATVIDFFPILKYVPTWLPGTSYLKYLAEAKEQNRLAFVTPMNIVKKEKEAGIAKNSFMAQLLESLEDLNGHDEEYEEDIAALGGIIFMAGSETSVATLYTFFLMMVLNPEVAKRAQRELDELFDEVQRLPSFNDSGRLPYINCIVKEVFRINPASPLGVAHSLMENDTYKGWSIPAGSIVVANQWQMMHDERYYPEPDRFSPERFLEPKLASGLVEAAHDPSNIVFGFGRRICPGQHFAEDVIWLTIANVLTVFDILPAIDPVSGKDLLPKVEYHSSTTSAPKPFACRVVPRQKYASMINAL